MRDDAQHIAYRLDYGRQTRVEPIRATPDVPGYLFCGALSGAAAGLAALTDLVAKPPACGGHHGDGRATRNSLLAGWRSTAWPGGTAPAEAAGLTRIIRLTAAAAAVGTVATLARDLGRPERFLASLRTEDPTFPLSLGSWLVLPFAGLVAGTAAADLGGRPKTARRIGTAAGLIGPAVCTYTAVWLADTDVPAWRSAYRELPFLFAGNGVTSAAGIALIAASGDDLVQARRLAVAGALVELAAAARLQTGRDPAYRPYRSGRAGALLGWAAALTVAGTALALLGGSRFGRRGRIAAALGGGALLGAGLLTRLGVCRAGLASAQPPPEPTFTEYPEDSDDDVPVPAGMTGARPGRPA